MAGRRQSLNLYLVVHVLPQRQDSICPEEGVDSLVCPSELFCFRFHPPPPPHKSATNELRTKTALKPETSTFFKGSQGH